ncbi:hypothetical protein TCAL_08160 [Tigriopus californicus]|uniref:thioredoxin-dependent peroxiredoxin n=1 Tax=Tigriopus californicus TaxID=6832 RepID=A0A553P3T2_TIGCA|nr:hypothetical protein TCAL_08160 [Tigriopus californicus]|eukprot:TCALIF_08160-PA protein Name:"Similar to PRDX1 Peroxiredoxin-1 (Gallus gallus)" AED:0.50 eAED:0.50 QI:0/0/0/1/1/1/2/0/192
MSNQSWNVGDDSSQLNKQLWRKSKEIMSLEDITISALRPPLKMNSVDFNEYNGRMVLIYFYQYDFVEESKANLFALADRFSDFEEANCQILTCSCDSVYVHFAWQTLTKFTEGVPLLERTLPFPMLADKAKVLTTTLGIYDHEEGIAQPTLVFVDKIGTIRQQEALEPNATLDIDDILNKVTDLAEPRVVSE